MSSVAVTLYLDGVLEAILAEARKKNPEVKKGKTVKKDQYISYSIENVLNFNREISNTLESYKHIITDYQHQQEFLTFHINQEKAELVVAALEAKNKNKFSVYATFKLLIMIILFIFVLFIFMHFYNTNTFSHAFMEFRRRLGEL